MVQDVLNQNKMLANEKLIMPTYVPMLTVMSKLLIKNLSRNCSFNTIIDKFFEGNDTLKSLLIDGANPFIKRISTIDNILEFLNDFKNIIQNGKS